MFDFQVVMPPKRLAEIPWFSSDSVPRSHRKKKTPSNSDLASRTVVDCFPSTSKAITLISPPRPESPVRVPRNPFARKGARMVERVCTEDLAPSKKRVTFDLSEYFSPDSMIPPTSEVSLPQSSPNTAPMSNSLPFGQSLSLLLPEPPLPPKTPSEVVASSCPGDLFVLSLVY